MAVHPTNKALTESGFNRAKVVDSGRGANAISTSTQQYAPKSGTPTTAAGDPKKKLPETVEQVDPQGLSQVLPNMYRNFKQVRDILNALNSMNFGLPSIPSGGGGGSSGNITNPDAYAATAIKDVFSGALQVVANRFGYYQTLGILFYVLGNDNYKNILEAYQNIVFEAIINLIKIAEEKGIENIPIPEIPQVIYGTKIPKPVYDSYEQVPNFYVQQYYTTESDPFPGYIQYTNNTGDFVYVRRTLIDYPYESSELEIFTTAQYDMADELLPYFTSATLTVEILNDLLVKYCTEVINDSIEKTMGKNSKNNLLSLLSSFAGIAATMANMTRSSHLPPSVLDQGSVNKTLDKHIESIGLAKKIKENMRQAVTPAGLALNLGAISSLTSLLGGGNFNISNITGIINSVSNISGIAGSIGNISGIINNAGNIINTVGNITGNRNFAGVANDVRSIVNNIKPLIG